MSLAEEIFNRQTEVQAAVKKSSKEFLFKIISTPKDWDIDIFSAAIKEWEARKP